MTMTMTTTTTLPTTMNTLAPATHELERQLRTLSLSGMAQTLLARNQEAISHHLAYTEFLELLVSDEFARRRDRLFTRRLKAARVPQLKTLESFDWSFNPQIPKALILDLGTVRFIPEHGGLLLLGPPGTGKSHIALSLTVAAIQAGYTAYYRSAFDLAQDLAEADATGTRPELIKKLTPVDLLVIEDLGMRHMPPTAGRGQAARVPRTLGAQDGDAARLVCGATGGLWPRKSLRRYSASARNRPHPQWPPLA